MVTESSKIIDQGTPVFAYPGLPARQAMSGSVSFFKGPENILKRRLSDRSRRRRRTVPQLRLFLMYYVYLIRSIGNPKLVYVGYTTNVEQRLETHNSGGSIHTKLDRPWQLIMYFAFDTQEKAFEFEKYMESGAGRAFAKKRLW